MRPDHTVDANNVWRLVSAGLARNGIPLRAFVFVGREAMVTVFSRIVRTCARGIAAAIVAGAAVPAHADVTDVLREIERGGYARIIVRMRAQTDAAAWIADQPATRQRAAVAAALDEMRPALRDARIEGARSFRTLPFVAATVSREQLLSLLLECWIFKLT